MTQKELVTNAQEAGHQPSVESMRPFRLACSCGFKVEGRATRTEARREMNAHLRSVVGNQ